MYLFVFCMSNSYLDAKKYVLTLLMALKLYFETVNLDHKFFSITSRVHSVIDCRCQGAKNLPWPLSDNTNSVFN